MSGSLESAEDRVQDEMLRAIRRGRRFAGRLAVQVDPALDAAAYGLLYGLAEHEQLRASEIAATLALDKSTVSRHVAHLVRLGLVERVRDPEDGRALLLRMTPAGAARFGEVRQRRIAEFRGALADWSAQDMEQLATLMNRLNNDLDGTPPGGD